MPKARWCSALLTRISTLPPISAASSRTLFESVTSSGSSVTWEVLLNSSKPENFFQGSAYPTQMTSAPALASAFTIVCHVGSLLLGKRHEHRLPGTVKPGGHAHSRGRRRHAAMQVRHHCRAAVEVHEAEAPRQPFAEEQVVAVVKHGVG